MSNEENEFTRALRIGTGMVLGLVMKAAIDLDLFQIIAKAAAENATPIFGDEALKLSPDEIVARLSTKNAEAPAMLDRILRFLAANSILTGDVVAGEDGKDKNVYGLAPMCKYYISDACDGVSFAPFLLMLQDKVTIAPWYHLKDAVLEGGVAFDKAYGMSSFEYPATDNRFNTVFNKAMYNYSTIIMNNVLEVYTGFKGLTEIVDVGGGPGATLAKIISKYPHIKGINFDLPHVVKDARPIPGVEHVGGDMFASVPKGKVIFTKGIMHDWGDEHCIKLLKNCWNALPESGKIIAAEFVLPEYSNTGFSTNKFVSDFDMVMLTLHHGGKERTLKEFKALAIESGFIDVKLICNPSPFGIIEFYKM